MTGVDADTLAELTSFLDAELPAFAAEFGRRSDFAAAMAWHRIMAAGNWVGLNWPAEFGGRAMDLETQVACETMLRAAGAPQIAGFIGVNTVAAAIMQWGTVEQKSLLPRIRSGEVLYCQGFSEPDAGSDLAGLRTRADVRNGEFVVTGQKVWTSHGTEAQGALILVRTTAVEGGGRSHRGLTLLLVPLDLPGVTVSPIRQLTGACEFAEIFLDEVRVPAGALLGPLDEGWKVAMSTLSHERAASLILASRTVADVRSLLTERSSAVTEERRDEALQLLVDAEVLGLLAERSVAETGGGHPGPAQSLVKLAWSRIDQRYADTAFALAGPNAAVGLDQEMADALLFSRSSTIAAGTTEVVKSILAEQVLGLPR